MKNKFWCYFVVVVQLYIYGRMYDWFVSNINQYTMSYSNNAAFAGTIICVPCLISFTYFIINKRISTNKLANKKSTGFNFSCFDVFGYFVKIYNILCFVYCIVDREFKLISKFLYTVAELVLADCGVVSFILLLTGLIVFGLLERYKNTGDGSGTVNNS